MTEIQPVLHRILPFDAENGAPAYFAYTGSRQMTDNNLVITDVTTGLIVYGFDFNSYEKVHHIPPSVLVNGETYTAKIRVKFEDGTYSPFSNDVRFKTLQTPVLDIENIDGQGYVYNADVTFVANYSQANNEIVKNYRFILLDENQDTITTFPRRIPDNQSYFTETAKDLAKGKGYFIRCEIETINGLTYSHQEKFIPMYLIPSINGVITTRNDSEEGAIRLTGNMKQIIGTKVKNLKEGVSDGSVEVDQYEYALNEWIMIPKDDPLIFTGLEMNRASDFVIKLWFKNIPENTIFMELSPTGDEGISVYFWKYKDRIVAEKRMGSVVARYTSNVIETTEGQEYMLFVKAIEHRIDLNITLT